MAVHQGNIIENNYSNQIIEHFIKDQKNLIMYNFPPTFLTRLDTIIANNLHDEHFSIETLSRELCISYTHTYRKIRRETGLSPSMYICKKRLEVACQLIEKTDLNMGEIAYQVGFNTETYFSKCFSAEYNCPPGRYRNRLAI